MERVISIGLAEPDILRNQENEKNISAQLGLSTHVVYRSLTGAMESFEQVKKSIGHTPALIHIHQIQSGQLPLNLASKNALNELTQAGLEKTVAKIDPRWVSFGLGYSADSIEKIDKGGISAKKAIPAAKLKQQLVKNIKSIQKLIPKTTVAVMNLGFSDKSNKAYQSITDPKFISAVVKSAGCSLIINLTHIEKSLPALKIKTIADYLRNIPLNKVIEIRMASVTKDYLSLMDGLLAEQKLPELRAVTTHDAKQLESLDKLFRNRGIITLSEAISVNHYFDLTHFEHRAVFNDVTRVWQVLSKISGFTKNYIAEKFKKLQPRTSGSGISDKAVIEGNVHIAEGAIVDPFVVIKGGNIYIGPGAKILAGSVIDGDVWIEEKVKIGPQANVTGPSILSAQCEIRPGTYIRGNVIFGHHTEFRSEAKNAIIMNDRTTPENAHAGSAAAHYSYVGDSVIGNAVNFGAGTKCSNVKTTWDSVGVNIDGWKFDTGLFKFGAMVGDLAATGCNTILNPGVLFGKASVSYPNSSISGYVPPGYMLKLRQTQEGVLRKPYHGPSLEGRGEMPNPLLKMKK